MPFYPGAVDYKNGVITVDEALSMPSVIEERIGEVASKNLLVDTIFATDAGPVDGGAVFYSKITEKNFFTENDVTERTPGGEYGVVYRQRPEAELAKVRDYGGKFAVSDEARTRNQTIDFDNDVQALTNTIVRKLNQRAVETVEAAEASGDVIQLATNQAWRLTRLDGDPAGITAPADRPAAHIADAFALAETKDLGITYTKMLVNPMTKAELTMVYGTELKDMLDMFGLELIATNYVDETAAYLIDPGKAGFVRYEEPLTVTTWRDEAHRQTWVQAYAMPVMGVTMPSAIAKITGVGV